MRDVDVDCTTVLIARRDRGIAGLSDLRGKRLALGDGGSRAGAILPLHYLRQVGIDTDGDLQLRSYTAGRPAISRSCGRSTPATPTLA
jgi:ABC-type phosphate/phosphonate transport system substrate-binding protein